MNIHRTEITNISCVERIVTAGALVHLAAVHSAVAPRLELRVWAPPESPVRIEYPPDLFSEISGRASGILWGIRDQDCVRVLEWGSLSGCGPALSGSSRPIAGRGQLIGKFFSRIRGEVFLAESDLAELDQMDLPDPIALVIAGSKAGFFVHCRDGTMQTLKSYQEVRLER